MSTLEMKTDIDEMMMMESTSQQMKLETKAGDDKVPGSTTRKGPPPHGPTRGTSQGKEILSSSGPETDKNPPAKVTTNACVLPSSAAQQTMPSKPPPLICANKDDKKNVSISTPGKDSSAVTSLKLKLPFGKTSADRESDRKPASPAIRRGEKQYSMASFGSLFGGATKPPGGFTSTSMPEGDGERSRAESSKAPEGGGPKTARKMGETHPTEPTAKAAPMISADMGKMKAKEDLAASAPLAGKSNTHKSNTKSDRDSSAPATAIPSLWGTLNYQAPATKPLSPGIADDSWVNSPNSICHTQISFNQCKICMEPLMSPSIAPDELPVSLNACGHIFHRHCLREALKHQSSLRCPECSGLLLSGKDCLPYLRGKMPSGSLTWLRVASVSCAGFEGCGCIRLNYAILSSIQKSYHPNPGEHHGSAHRTAYLPDNHEGRELFSRLQVAFLCGLTFSVGTSLTTGRDNAVTWGSLHHKTSTSGGITCHGYPDESYLSNCNAELDAAGVPNSVICSEHVRRHEYNLKFWQGDSIPASASQLLLFHLIHARHCTSAGPCPVVSGCSKFKALNQHIQYCTNRRCEFNNCKEAKAVLAHFDKKSPQCQGCGICGILPSAIKGAENISKNFAELRYQDLSDYTRLANLKLPTNRFEATFFYEQNVRDVFASPSSNLFDVLSKVNSSELPKFLEQNGVPNTVVEMNPHISIESFLPHISIESFVEEGIKCCAQDQDLHVRIVFHGTPEINVESILRRGLDQSKRKRQLYGPGEYFSSCPAMSIQNYCRGGQRVIVFAIIAGNADIRTREIVVVEKPQRQLPIATLHFANNFQISKVNQSKPSPQTSDQDANDRNKRGRLLLLRHASKCTAKNGQCTVTPHCAEMKAVWKHIANCKDSNCNFPHCMSSRYTLSHWRKCKPPCNICDPLRQMIKNADMNQINSHLAVKGDDGSGAGSGSMGMGGGGMAKCTPAPAPVSQPPDQPPNKRQRRDPAP